MNKQQQTDSALHDTSTHCPQVLILYAFAKVTIFRFFSFSLNFVRLQIFIKMNMYMYM